MSVCCREACKKKAQHPLETQHAVAARGMQAAPYGQANPDPWADTRDTEAYKPKEPIHIAPKSYIEQLRNDVLQV